MDTTQKSKKQSEDIELDDKDLLTSTKSAIEAVKKKKKSRTKNIGKAIIMAESQKDKAKKPSIDAKKLPRDDLLQMAASIEVNDSTLIKIYETRLINEKGLRRLINIHLSGEDIRPALRKEIIDETSNFGENQIIEYKKEAEFNRKRLYDALFVAGMTTVVVLFIVFMVRRF
ncbi:MAG: hypothetical protein EBZ47_09775 [Chlamydiae bacterium]|nr:hypothetical protein [Chlamydiota bacterium]